MKILFVYDILALWGGVERVISEKLNYFAREFGYEVHVVTTNQGEHPLSFPLEKGVSHEDLHIQSHLQYRYSGLKRYWIRYCKNRLLKNRLKAKIEEINPDIVIGTTAVYMPLLIQLRGNYKLVAESHSGFDHVKEFESATWWQKLEMNHLRTLLGKTDVLVSLTESDAAKWRTVHPCVEVIPNIVHLNQTGRYSSLEERRVIFVGRFCRQKSIPDLLAVWRIVHQRHPDWRLDMYGDGEYLEMLQNEIKSMDANITVHEPTLDIMEKYCESSMLVLTSLYEPFGLVMVEAMSCGLPVVSFESDGAEQILMDGDNGFIVKDRNIEAFADRVCRLIEDQPLRQQMGKNGILSSRRFSAEQVMPRWKDLFETIVRERSSNKKD